jgi:hypothetical protein
MMQAFIYRHLVPSQRFMVAVTGPPRRGRTLELASESPVRVPVGGTTRVRMTTPRYPKNREVVLELRDPPEGVTLEDVETVPGGLAFLLRADGKTATAGPADNLIVEAFMETTGGKPDGSGVQGKRRFSIGVLPAIPMEIVQR